MPSAAWPWTRWQGRASTLPRQPASPATAPRSCSVTTAPFRRPTSASPSPRPGSGRSLRPRRARSSASPPRRSRAPPSWRSWITPCGIVRRYVLIPPGDPNRLRSPSQRCDWIMWSSRSTDPKVIPKPPEHSPAASGLAVAGRGSALWFGGTGGRACWRLCELHLARLPAPPQG